MTSLSLSDGRTLDIQVNGADDGPVLVFHHGTPGSLLPRKVMVEQAAERGLRLVTYSRAGYGESTRRKGRTVADIADDVTAICLLAAPEGIEHMTRALSGSRVPVRVVTAAIDDRLNENGFIVPGLGDAGDRLYGVV